MYSINATTIKQRFSYLVPVSFFTDVGSERARI
jgi:hypothetical protein